jgi:3-oxoacyl-[acyl-carrier-protein] synthase-1
VTGIGVATSLGSDPAGIGAAVRAAIARPSPHPVVTVWDDEVGEGAPATVHAVPSVQGFDGTGRLIALSSRALASLQENMDLRPARCALFVAVSSGRVLLEAQARAIALADQPVSGDDAIAPAAMAGIDSAPPDYLVPPQGTGALERFRADCTDKLLPWLRKAFTAYGEVLDAQLFFTDAPGFVDALMAAQRALSMGKVDRCIVGAVDSLLDGDRIDALQYLGLLHSPENPVGTLPGEAAAFLVLETPTGASRSGRRIHAEIDAPAVDEEPVDAFSDGPTQGAALVRAIAASFAQIEGGELETGLVIADLNGQTARARDWGNVLVRNRALGGASVETWTPASSWGDVGAAIGPLAVCLAARAFARGYARLPRSLVWLWGELGQRGAFSVRAPPLPGGR